MKPIIIIGGGWAGLAAAISLTEAGKSVHLLESAKQLGGRARSFERHGVEIDNGQHLLLGAYQHTLTLWRTLGLAEQTLVKRQALNLQLLDAQSGVQLITPQLPAPLHLLSGLLNTQGLSRAEKWQTLLAMLKIQTLPNRCATVRELLTKHHMPAKASQYLWEPLCIAALNTLPEDADADLFIHVLKQAFQKQRADSDLLIPIQAFNALLVDPALRYLRNAGQQITTQCRVSHISQHEHGFSVHSPEQTIEAAQIILAVPPHQASKLFPAGQLRDWAQKLQAYAYEPICTAYLQYPPSVQLDFAMQGSVNTLGQWYFDRGLFGQNGLISVVISASGPHQVLSREDLLHTLEQELASHYPKWPKPLWRELICEKRATFKATPQLFRPPNQTPVSGLWLAGDYTDTGLPATLEGAIQSGVNCAKQLFMEYR